MRSGVRTLVSQPTRCLCRQSRGVDRNVASNVTAVLLTITTHQPATDLGFLLHKNPERLHDGGAVVRAGARRSTRRRPTSAAPPRCSSRSTRSAWSATARARGQRVRRCAQYVNDRPYVASSFLRVAISKLFGTAMTGRSKERPELADAHPPCSKLASRCSPCRGRRRRCSRRLFEPLGYDGGGRSRSPLDAASPSGATAATSTSRSAATMRARDLLEHLFVLLPVLDDDKHYWVGDDEVDKLLRRGGDWLAAPPRTGADRPPLPPPRPPAHHATPWPGCSGRGRRRRPATSAEAARRRGGGGREADQPQRAAPRRRGRRARPRRRPAGCVDLGCGEGKLLRRLLRRPAVRPRSSASTSRTGRWSIAARRLRLDDMPPRQRAARRPVPGRAHLPRPPPGGLRRGGRGRGRSSTSTRPACGAFERGVFGDARPQPSIVTTPNVEYNVLFETLPAGTAPPPRPPLRVDAGRVRDVGRRRRARATATPSSSRHRDDDAEARCADADGGVPPMTRSRIPELSPRRARRRRPGRASRRSPRRHFRRPRSSRPTSAAGLVSDDENDQAATDAAFDVLHFIAGKRLEAGQLTVVDATNVQPEARTPLVALARRPPRAAGRHRARRARGGRAASATQPRPDRDFGAHVIRNQRQPAAAVDEAACSGKASARSSRSTGRRRDRRRHRRARAAAGPTAATSTGPSTSSATSTAATTSWSSCSADSATRSAPTARRRAIPTAGGPSSSATWSTAGPATPDVLRLVMAHGRGRRRAVRPRQPREQARCARCGAATSQSATGWPSRSPSSTPSRRSSRTEVATFIDGLVSHSVLDGGKLVVAHAGLPEEMHGRASGAVRSFALYGDTTGETDEFGLPVRYPWADDYRGERDGRLRPHAGAGGGLGQQHDLHRHRLRVRRHAHGAALARARAGLGAGAHARTTSRPRPLAPSAGRRGRRARPADLDLDDVLGKRIIDTRLDRTVTIREENAAAALEVMSRFAVDPRWLVYLPPTMSPTRDHRARRPARASGRGVRRLRRDGVTAVVCEEKHMGSRAVVVVCRDERRGRARRFGVDSGRRRIVYTRTGRPFFDDAAVEQGCSTRCAPPSTRAGLWDELETDWLVLDCELLPWSAKAEELLRRQYASVGAAAMATLGRRGRGRAGRRRPRRRRRRPAGSAPTERAEMAGRLRRRLPALLLAGRRLDDLALAPFQVLAGRGQGPRRPRPPLAPRDRSTGSPRPTRRRSARTRPASVVDLDDARQRGGGDRAGGRSSPRAGGEGMVVKPVDLDRRRAARASSSRASSAAAASTCASSTARSTPPPPTSSGCASAASAASASSPCASSPRHRGARTLRRRRAAATASTSASSACSPSRANRSTRACSRQ